MMFTNERYLTREVADRVPIDIQLLMWDLVQQIEEKDYIARLKQDGMQNFIKYGIACFKKNCKVTMGD